VSDGVSAPGLSEFEALIDLEVAGLGIRVRTAAGLSLDPGPEHEAFRVAATGEDLIVDYTDGAERGWFERGSEVFNAHDALRFFEDPEVSGGLLLEIACGRRTRCEARFSPDRSHVEVRLAPWRPSSTLLTLPRAYEVACATRFARSDVLVVHALGLILPGIGGVLLPASTGHGKSTLGSLHQVGEVLSDERVALALNSGTPSIYGTPLRATGRRVQAEGAPLRALVFLGAHGDGFGLRPLRRAEAFRRLAFHGLPPFWDRDGLERTVDVALASAKAVPAFELSFVPGDSARDQLREALCRVL
jgi:hypothetical protein